MRYLEIIDNLVHKTDKVILFHSATGKDSICLLDLCSQKFTQVICVFMYFVPGLGYEERYIKWAEDKYPNCTFIKTPHVAVYSFIKHGYLGIKQDRKQVGTTLAKIDAQIRKKTGIQWSIYGFKKVDSLNRRLMLNTYPDGIMEKTQKAYPLMDLKNSDVLNYIRENNLIEPFNYSKTKPSSGCDVSQPEFLAYIRTHYPDDLKKIFSQYPLAEVNLFKHDSYGKNKAE